MYIYVPNRPMLLCRLKFHGRRLPIFGRLLTIAGIVQRLRLVSATLRLSYCPALSWFLHVEFMPFMGLRLLSSTPLSNLIHHVLFAILVSCSSYHMYHVCTRYLIELFFPRARLVFCSPCVYLETIREPSRSLRGLRWPGGNERFRTDVVVTQCLHFLLRHCFKYFQLLLSVFFSIDASPPINTCICTLRVLRFLDCVCCSLP